MYCAGFLVAAATSVFLGLLLFSALRIPLKGIERLALAFLAGSAQLSLIVFALAAVGLARTEAYAAIAIGAALAGARPFERGEPAPLNWSLRAVAAAAFAVFGCIYFLHAAAPELSPDGSYYHLGFVSLYHEHGRLVKVTDNMFAHMPQAVEMLFLFAFAFGEHSAASLVHLGFLVALAGLVYCYGKRIGKPAAGLFAAFAVFASPIVGWDATRAYVDVALAAATFGAFYLLELWDEAGNRRYLALAGLLAGFAFGAKYTGALALALGAVLILIERRPWALAVFLAVALAVFSPWALRNWIWVGNPLSPFFAEWFPNPYVFPIFTSELAALMRAEHFPGWGRLPLETTVRGCHVQGLVGPLFLFAPIGLLSCRTAQGRRLCAGAAILLALNPAAFVTRYLIPALPFVALAMALALVRGGLAAGALILLHAVTSHPRIVDRYCHPHAMRLERTPPIVTRREEYLRSKAMGYEVARMVERHVPPEAEVYSFVSFPEAYSRKKALTYFTSARANMITEVLFTPIDVSPLLHGRRLLSGLDPRLAPVCRLEYRFPPATLRRLRLVQPSDSAGPLWTITDIKVLSGEAEVPVRVTASVCPWYAGYAADGNPVTLWSARQPTRKGMFVELDPGAPRRADRVLVIAPPDQCAGAARLEGELERGRWVTLQGHPIPGRHPLPPDLRTRAACEVRSRGIEFLLVNEGNLVADDIRAHAAEWRVEAVATAENFTLYRINCPPEQSAP